MNWFISYFFCFKKVLIEGVYFDWSNIEVGVFEGLVLGLLLFFIYINDLLIIIIFDCFWFLRIVFFWKKLSFLVLCL